MKKIHLRTKTLIHLLFSHPFPIFTLSFHSPTKQTKPIDPTSTTSPVIASNPTEEDSKVQGETPAVVAATTTPAAAATPTTNGVATTTEGEGVKEGEVNAPVTPPKVRGFGGGVSDEGLKRELILG